MVLLCCDSWGPLELYSKSKTAKNLNSWPLYMPQKSEHWAELKLNMCTVSNVLVLTRYMQIFMLRPKQIFAIFKPFVFCTIVKSLSGTCNFSAICTKDLPDRIQSKYINVQWWCALHHFAPHLYVVRVENLNKSPVVSNLKNWEQQCYYNIHA